jgi:hypothetical protein
LTKEIIEKHLQDCHENFAWGKVSLHFYQFVSFERFFALFRTFFPSLCIVYSAPLKSNNREKKIGKCSRFIERKIKRISGGNFFSIKGRELDDSCDFDE